MCIYLTDQIDLTYNSSEHIFPAAIGGIRKLPQGYVSDRFNNNISKLELEFIRYNLISIPRQIEGPGKRGKMGIDHATKSEIHILSKKDDLNNVTLGFIQLGIPFLIPQINYNILSGEIAISFDNTLNLDPADSFLLFKENAEKLMSDKVRYINSEMLAKGCIIIGYTNIKSDLRFYLARHPKNDFKITKELLRKLIDSIQVNNGNQNEETYMPISNQQMIFKIEQLRIPAKICINALAYLMSSSFILKSELNQIRKWITHGGENNFVKLGSPKEINISSILSIPSSAHFVIFSNTSNGLIAHLSLYNGMDFIVKISEIALNELPSLCGYICDWKNQQESKIIEHLNSILHDSGTIA